MPVMEGDALKSELVSMAAKLIRAYLECSDELQKHTQEMVEILNTSTDDDEIRMAKHTIWEVLFPERHDAGVTIEHLDECAITEQADGDASKGELESEEEQFAARLQACMEAARTTQGDLASRAGVGQPAISMMLKRNCRPQRRTIIKLAEALGVSPNELWGDFK